MVAAGPILAWRRSAPLPHRRALLDEGARALELILARIKPVDGWEAAFHDARKRVMERQLLALPRDLLDGGEHERRAFCESFREFANPLHQGGAGNDFRDKPPPQRLIR